MDPINYSAQLTQLDLSPLQHGLAQRRQNKIADAEIAQRTAVTQLAQAKFTREMEDDAAFKSALTGFSQNPTATSLLELSARFPSHAEALTQGFKTYTAKQQQDLIGTATSALGALAAGNVDAAKDVLSKRRGSLANSGIDTSHTDAAISLATSADPVKRRQGMALLSTVLLGAVGPEEAAKVMRIFGLDAESENKRADDARADRAQGETERHNRVTEAQGAARVDLSAAAGARAAAKGGGKGGKKGAYTDAQLDALIQ